MKRTFILLAVITAALAAAAQATPDLRLHTTIYESVGPTNAFTLTLGAAPGHTGYADVVCSGGNQSEAEIISAYYDESTYSLLATNIACQVDAQGIVEVYCDEGVVIDYICVTGAEVTEIEVKNPKAVEILSLEHNMLRSLDLTEYTNLTALYLGDNPFDASPLIVGRNKPNLSILDISMVENLDADFDIDTYPALQSFDAMGTRGLHKLTPAACPKLQKISIDNTMVSSLDVTHNPQLLILNISESRIGSIDLRTCTRLQQLYATHSSAMNTDVKLTDIDLSNCPDLIYLFLTGNRLTTIDVSKNTKLRDLYVADNRLTSINLDNNPALVNVFLQRNYMNFNTLPIPRETWTDYDLRQRPINVPRSYLVGSPLDLSAQIRRPDSETVATVFTQSENQPGIDIEVDASNYTFTDGVINFNTVLPDSVYVSFYNGTFPDITLETVKFKIKDETTFGADDKAAAISTTLTTGKPVKMHVGVLGASEETPKTFYVDFGNGTKMPFTATTSLTPDEPNVDIEKPCFGTMVIYMPEGEKMSALKMGDTKILSLDLSASHQLSELSLTGTQMSNIDLRWNNQLTRLELTGNNFADRLTLAGANGSYNKNLLSHIVLSDNNMSVVKLNEPGSWKYIDISNNQLTALDFTDADNLEYLDISHNLMPLLKVNYCGKMHTLKCNDNQLDSIFMPEEFNLRYVDFTNNRFTLKNMPLRYSLTEEQYLYAPQAEIEIPSKGPGYNLRDQYVEIDDETTQYSWYTTEGKELVAGTDYTIDKGVTRFADSTIGSTLVCRISHPAYPAFTGDNALCTTPMLSAGMPTHLLGSFTTPRGGDVTRLSIASAVSGDALYIDWTGTETLDQYPMTTTYTVYNPVTTAGANVKVWSYDEVDNLRVFSLGGTPMTDADFSPMQHLTAFTLSDAGTPDIKLPQSPGLSELNLDNNGFTSFDSNAYPRLSFLSMAGNKFTELDLSTFPSLSSANFSNNLIESVKVDNSSIWNLGLSNNRISQIDLSNAPAMYQLFLDNNELSSIDLSHMPQLKVIYLDHNRFDFSNLPIPQDQWTVYTYGGQPEIHIEAGDIVDLSYLAERDGVATTFTWFYGYPDIDTDSGEISGEELYEDEEYIIENGVTTFLAEIDRACCVLTNPLFPRTYLITNAINVCPTGITDIVGDASHAKCIVSGRTVTVTGLAPHTAVAAYTTSGTQALSRAADNNGSATFTLPSRGIFLIKAGSLSAKISAK